MCLPFLFVYSVVQVVLPSLAALFWGFEVFSFCSEVYLFGYLVPICSLYLPRNLKYCHTLRRIS